MQIIEGVSSLPTEDKTFVMSVLNATAEKKEIDEETYLQTQIVPRYITLVRMKRLNPSQHSDWDDLSIPNHLKVIRILADSIKDGNDLTALSDSLQHVTSSIAGRSFIPTKSIQDKPSELMKGFLRTSLQRTNYRPNVSMIRCFIQWGLCREIFEEIDDHIPDYFASSKFTPSFDTASVTS